jgi:hypothetical protein
LAERVGFSTGFRGVLGFGKRRGVLVERFNEVFAARLEVITLDELTNRAAALSNLRFKLLAGFDIQIRIGLEFTIELCGITFDPFNQDSCKRCMAQPFESLMGVGQ